MDFQLHTDYKPQGDQPQAIRELVSGLHAGEKDQTLLGVTGSGKTFTMAKVIAELNRPDLRVRLFDGWLDEIEQRVQSDPAVSLDFYQITNRGSRLSDDAKEFSGFLKMYIANWSGTSNIH